MKTIPPLSCFQSLFPSNGQPSRVQSGLNKWRSLFYWRESACRQHRHHWLTVFLNDWFTDWTYTLTDFPAATECALYLCRRLETQQYSCVFCPSSTSGSVWGACSAAVYYLIQPAWCNTLEEYGVWGFWCRWWLVAGPSWHWVRGRDRSPINHRTDT